MQGRRSLFLCGQAIREIFNIAIVNFSKEFSTIVQSTISMRSMLMLGGSRGMPPRKILKNRCSKIKFGAFKPQIMLCLDYLYSFIAYIIEDIIETNLTIDYKL